jgi:hypothetical protein
MQQKLVLACFVIVILATFMAGDAEALALNNCKVASLVVDPSNNSFDFAINSVNISNGILFYIPIYPNDTPAQLAFKAAQFDLLSDAYFHEKSVTIEGNLDSGRFEIRIVSIGDHGTEFPPVCSIGLTKCGNGCFDLRTDAKNCGACGTICPAGKTCNEGTCSGCAAGLTKCANGCFDLRTDAKNCGACGTICPAGKACENGACVG